MATYINNLRLKEITTGDEDGTWGTSTNTNLDLIADALGYGTEDCFTTDANSVATVADATADPARAMYFKVTSSATLTTTRVLTIAPNTMSRVMFIENATTGSQTITIYQGTGTTVDVATGTTKLIYLDGAGATASVVDISTKLGGLTSGDIGVTVQAYSAILDATTASFTTADETKLDGIEAGAEVNDATTLLDADIGVSVQAYSAVLAGTTASFTTADETKLDGIEAGAEVNDATTLLDADIGVNVQAYSTVLANTTASFTTADESKLDGIEAGAEVNDPTTLLDAAIGVTVLAYDANLQAFVSALTLPTTDGTTGQALLTNGSGVVAFGDVDAGSSTLAETLTAGNTTGGTDIDATGDGITFDSGSNVLDDYEEGTFTLTLTSASGSGTLSRDTGEYIKIGSYVYFQAELDVSSVAGMTSYCKLSGLPFANNGYNNGLCNVGASVSGLSIPSTSSLTGDLPNVGANTINIYVWDATTGTTALTPSELGGSSGFTVSGFYQTSV